MGKIERIQLAPGDRERLEKLVRDRNTPQKVVWRARIVLLAGDGWAPSRSRGGRQERADRAPLATTLCVGRGRGLVEGRHAARPVASR